MVVKTYDQIWREWSAKYAGSYGYSEHELRRIHVKWKKIAAEVK